jgi:serine/threonine protein kinase/Leucine-rich repeat (LRR) protein
LTELNLADNSLTGPVVLKGLSSLRLLTLKSNQLTGAIPSLTRMQEMSSLVLYSNSLTGTIPSELLFLPELTEVLLHNNQFHGTLPPKFVHPSIKFLDVSDNNLSGSIPFLAGYVDPASQRVLNFANNGFSGEFPWKAAENASVIRLNNNKFSGDMSSFTGENASTMWWPLEFSVRNNAFTGQFKPKASRLARAEFIDLSGNSDLLQVHLDSFKGLSPVCHTQPGKHPDISNCVRMLALDSLRLSGTVPSFIFKLSSLWLLSMKHNQLTGTIPDLSNLTELRTLDLSNNTLVGTLPKGFVDLPVSSSACRRLSPHNRIKGMGRKECVCNLASNLLAVNCTGTEYYKARCSLVANRFQPAACAHGGLPSPAPTPDPAPRHETLTSQPTMIALVLVVGSAVFLMLLWMGLLARRTRKQELEDESIWSKGSQDAPLLGDDAERIRAKGDTAAAAARKEARFHELLAAADYQSGFGAFLPDDAGAGSGGGAFPLAPSPRVDALLTVPQSELEMLERIGEGSYGKVYKARWRGSIVALKMLKPKTKVAKPRKKKVRYPDLWHQKHPTKEAQTVVGGMTGSLRGGRSESSAPGSPSEGNAPRSPKTPERDSGSSGTPENGNSMSPLLGGRASSSRGTGTSDSQARNSSSTPLEESSSSDENGEAGWECSAGAFERRTEQDELKSFAKFEREVGILSRVRHHNVVRYIGCSRVVTPNTVLVSILMEFVEGGTLSRAIRKLDEVLVNTAARREGDPHQQQQLRNERQIIISHLRAMGINEPVSTRSSRQVTRGTPAAFKINRNCTAESDRSTGEDVSGDDNSNTSGLSAGLEHAGGKHSHYTSGDDQNQSKYLRRVRALGGWSMNMAMQITNGLEHLHQLGIVHRDIKPSNILVNSLWTNAKIADFGLSISSGSPPMISHERGGTAFYSAPETFQAVGVDESSIDIYSLGLVMWHLFTGEQLLYPAQKFPEEVLPTLISVVKDDLRPALPPEMPSRLQHLLCRCWHKDPAERPSCHTILRELTNCDLYEAPQPQTAVFGGRGFPAEGSASQRNNNNNKIHLLRDYTGS